jgi:hypothetical protein
MAQAKTINGILLLYYHPVGSDAPTIMEHINSFRRYSQFKVWEINTGFGFPLSLYGMSFNIIVLHYSLFGSSQYQLDPRFLDYLEHNKSSYKVAFFQDEHYFCQQRFEFLNRYKIDCVYILLSPEYFKDVYTKYTEVPKLVPTLPGYVSEHLVTKAKRFARPSEKRTIDVGYRARQLPFFMGKGAQEKGDIATKFQEYAKGTGLKIDINTQEGYRLYGNAWYKFLGNCKACLGVEAGVSIFDLDGTAYDGYQRLIAENQNMTFGEMSQRLLNKYEGNIPYRTISPRHFEAAAFRICQILYEGYYSGILKPMVHYIPLKKDFSNFTEVVGLLSDAKFCKNIVDNCYKDLIESGRYSYQRFIKGFDGELIKEGFQFKSYFVTIGGVSIPLSWEKYSLRAARLLYSFALFPLFGQYPGKKVLLFFGHLALRMYCRMRQYLKTFNDNKIPKRD